MRISSSFAVRWTAVLVLSIVLLWGARLMTASQSSAAPAPAAELQPIQLPQPAMAGGMPLMQALAERKTTREFLDKPLPLEKLSNLLWAAFGVNRKSVEWHDPSGKSLPGRTAPSAVNNQDVAIYVALKKGVYLYQAEQDRLDPVVAGDVRCRIESPPGGPAAVVLIYAAPVNDGSAQVDIGFIGQNVYLFAASERLNAWFYALHGQDVAGILKLPADRHVLYEQSVGYPPQ